MAAPRSHRAHPGRHRGAGHARRLRHRLGGAAVRGHARRRQRHCRARGSARADEGARRGEPRHALRRRRAAAGAQRRARRRGRAGAAGQHAGQDAPRRAARRRDARRPRPLHCDDERAAVLPRLADRHLDAAGHALGLDALGPHPPRREGSEPAGRARHRRGAGRGLGLMEAAGISAGVALEHHDDHHGDHHGPPPANRSSRVDPELLGMLLFIISEIMVFGAFFTAYFFIRLVAEGHRWFPFNGDELPVAVAGVNTCILLSSSLTMHWAQTSIKTGNRFGLKAGMLLTTMLGATFLFIQINEYVHIGFAPQDHAQGTIFYGLTGLHGAHVFIGLTLLTMVAVRSFRGHFSPEHHHGVEVPGIYWHFVDVMWVVVYTTIYIL